MVVEYIVNRVAASAIHSSCCAESVTGTSEVETQT